MDCKDSVYKKISHLTLLSIEDKLSVDQFDRLQALLETSPENRNYYLLLINIYLGLNDPECHQSLSGDTTSDADTTFQKVVIQDLEDSAIRRAIAQAESCHDEELAPGHSANLQRRRLSAADWRNVFYKAAAIILLCLSILWLDRWIMRESAIQPRRVVAQLIDQLNAQWDKSSRLPHDDGRMNQDTYCLTTGCAHIQFNCGANVVIEGPAEWALLAEDGMQLTRGRAYATVPPNAIGFAIKAGNAKVIDLGTEFGIEVDDCLNTQLHVIKGKTLIISGTDHGPKAQAEITQNQARQVDNNGKVQAIELADQRYVRRIDSSRNLAWKGQPAINLADIVGGGNGFGTGTLNDGIDIKTGKHTSRLPGQDTYKTEGLFSPSPNFYIDGVFVPGVPEHNTQISSTLLTTDAFPLTTGVYWGHVFNGALHNGLGVPLHNLKLDGVSLADKIPTITMHSNLGITFDLNHLENALPQSNIHTLHARIGLSETSGQYTDIPPKAEFWVLMDGRKCFHKLVTSALGGVDVELPIPPNTRFLSLAVTEAEDEYGYDWAVWTNPCLVFEMKNP